MTARLNFFTNAVAMKFARHLVAADRALAESGLPAATQELVKLRASQINGCGFCVDMHSKDAAHAGETATRLNLVAVWREATVFTEAERAALELTEQGTRIADAAGGVTDEAWADAAKHYDEDQLAALVCAIALINAFNRGNVIIQQPAGGYEPGRLH
ncbi:carboxymuconolactone decarboxylase family protein [Streptomyces spectabilis]|uniref:AhpD family alkylhydroperoxidase n=1 Tax=Streptomyces spectabilis TaxID=68270 RepID=A0A5P2X3Z4_STRST|nr:carboxymuconolactone decarboxylase family protein [Streptomyces spectabilis]MBB5101218.1 AhpD family alkylhydroperoxidase [Streptomyces spectabilis]MCI3900420.1 carboxymuconolactone decarboxylase family protein [Streptomyces spectabilis]QEV57999.1 carboxymuconolactone decarboxylase family protein [Streptomyces spectabilis]GGV10081.1 alkyl hydroperoxide reductase AhpD [Streptomyces spectabilis]